MSRPNPGRNAERSFWEQVAASAILRAKRDPAGFAVSLADQLLEEWRKRWKSQSQKCLTPNGVENPAPATDHPQESGTDH